MKVRDISALEAEDTFQRSRRSEAYVKGVLDTLRQLRGTYVTMNRDIHIIDAVPANEKDGAGRAVTACITVIDRWIDEWIKVEESTKQPAASDPEGDDHE